jgi:hypothetical protein
VLDASALDADRRARDRREADERADLDVVGADRVRGPVERRAAVHGHGVGADPVDPRAERDEEVGEVLHVRLARGVAEDRWCPPRRRPP